MLEEVRASRYTRYPVRDPESGRFTGLLHIKDLVTADERLRDIRDIAPYLRRLPYFSDDSPLPRVLAAFRAGDPHFAIVTNALGTEIANPGTVVVLEAKQRFPNGAKVGLSWGRGIATKTGVVTTAPQKLPFVVRPPLHRVS